MRLNRTTCLVVGLAAVAGCSRQEATPCEPEARYSTARSAPPVQIPDDLTPPNESDALRLPPQTVVPAPILAGECLETPPSFFGDSAGPVRSGAAAEQDEPRRSRREARREARSEAQGAEPAPAEPREPGEPPPAGSDERVIDN